MAVDPSTTPVPDATATRLVAERAYMELRDRIVTLHLPPGTVLREDELMGELGIGRTPLREAVKRLALENLVDVKPRRGTFVSAVESADIVSITEVRAELEGYAARNPYLSQTLERYFTHSLRIWYLVLDSVPSLDHAVHDQTQLLEAVLDRNGPHARTIMHEHVLAFQREILAAFSRT